MGTIDIVKDVEAIVSADDLYHAEKRFDEVKVRVLRNATSEESCTRARRYLKTIEDILAEKHEARRNEASRT